MMAIILPPFSFAHDLRGIALACENLYNVFRPLPTWQPQYPIHLATQPLPLHFSLPGDPLSGRGWLPGPVAEQTVRERACTPRAEAEHLSLDLAGSELALQCLHRPLRLRVGMTLAVILALQSAPMEWDGDHLIAPLLFCS